MPELVEGNVGGFDKLKPTQRGQPSYRFQDYRRLFLILSWLVNSLAWSYQVEVEMPGCPIFDAWGWSAASWISNSHGEERMGGTRISREEAINHLRLWCSQNGDVCEPESNWIIINLGLRKDNADDSEDSIEE